MYPGNLFRLIFAFILFGASAVVLVTILKTAVSDFNGSCLINAEVSPNSVCDQQCATGASVCAGGEGTCLGGQCSVECYEVSEGSSAQCWYVVAADALSVLLAMQLLFYAVVALAVRSPVGYASCIILMLTGLVMAAIMAAASAIITRGYVRLCNTLEDNGSDCGDDVNGFFVVNNLPYRYNHALQAALICGWIATLFWLLLALSSVIQMCLVRRHRQQYDYEMGPTKTTTTTFSRPGTVAAATGAGTGALAGALAPRPAATQDYNQTAAQYPIGSTPPRTSAYASPFGTAAATPGYGTLGAAAAPATTQYPTTYPTNTNAPFVSTANIPVGIPVASAAPYKSTATTAAPLASTTNTSQYPSYTLAPVPTSSSTAYPASYNSTTQGPAPAGLVGATRVYPPLPSTTNTTLPSTGPASWSANTTSQSQTKFPVTTTTPGAPDSRPYPSAVSGGL